MSVEAIDKDIQPANIVDNVNDHAPEPATPPVVEDVPEPPRPDVEGLAQLQEVVAGLATAVATLTETVMGKEKDESPTKLPWTHRGGPLPHADKDS